MSAAVQAVKQQEEFDSEPTLSTAIDLGDDQQKAVQALIESRVQQRLSHDSKATSSLFGRASLLFGRQGKFTDLSDVVDRSTSLTSLKRTGFIPEDFVQSGPQMTYKRLTNAYSVADLASFGFTFEHFCQLGFDSDDLRNFSQDDYRVLGLNADTLLTRLPLTSQDLINLKLSPHFLRELRFTFNHFANNLRMSKNDLEKLMSERDLKMYFSPTDSQVSGLARRGLSVAFKSASAPRSRFAPHAQSGKLNF